MYVNYVIGHLTKEEVHDNQLLVDVGNNKKEFNFPCLGKELVSLMRKFLPCVPLVQELTLTHHSVGGFVCEKEFISYIQKN